MLIFLLALLFLIILVYREVSTLKDHIARTLILFKQDYDRTMTKCVGQIKGISSENLQQLRKITLLNTQRIQHKIANQFTETDDGEMRTDIPYMSDVRDNKKKELQERIFEKGSNDFYMSEATGRSKDTELSKKPVEEEVQCEGDACPIPIYEKEPSIPIYVGKTQAVIIDDSDDGLSSNDSIGEQEVSPDHILEKSIVDDAPLKYKNNPKNKNEIEVDIFTVMNSNTLVPQDDDLMNDMFIDANPEKLDQPSDDTFNAEKTLNKIDLSDSLKDIMNLDEQIRQFKEDAAAEEEECVEMDEKSKMSFISAGGRAYKRKRTTQSVGPILINNQLKSYEEYNLNDIKEIARTLELPITYRDKNKTKSYKKDELYKNIENYLRSDNNQVNP